MKEIVQHLTKHFYNQIIKMTRTITNAVLAEKIDNLSNAFKDLKPEIKANTEFRLQAKGAFALLGSFSVMLGALTSWVLIKIWGTD